MNRILKRFSILILVMLLGCKEQSSVPLPYAFPRVELQDPTYEMLKEPCPFAFEVSTLTELRKPRNRENDCWLNVEYPELNATLYLSYQSISSVSELTAYVAEAQRMTFKHTIKASSIEEVQIELPLKDVYGFYYKVGGDAASNAQFFLTDSSSHFLRGAVYFNVTPEADSLAPLIQYVRRDVEKLIESFVWIE